jgi:hypothetical protein
MPTTRPLTRSRAIDRLADRLRSHFQERLHALFVLPDNPYEPAGDDEWIILVAILESSDSDDIASFSEEASQVGSAFEQEVEWTYISTIFTVPKAAYDRGEPGLVQTVRREGVRL